MFAQWDTTAQWGVVILYHVLLGVMDQWMDWMNVYLAQLDIIVPLALLIILIRFVLLVITVQRRLSILRSFLVFRPPLTHRQELPTSLLVSHVLLVAIVVLLDYQL